MIIFNSYVKLPEGTLRSSIPSEAAGRSSVGHQGQKRFLAAEDTWIPLAGHNQQPLNGPKVSQIYDLPSGNLT